MIWFDYKKIYFTNFLSILQNPIAPSASSFFDFDEVIYKYIINDQDKRLSQISNIPPPLGNLVRLNALVVYVLLRVSARLVLRFTSHIPSQFLGEGEDGRILGRKPCEFDCKMVVVVVVVSSPGLTPARRAITNMSKSPTIFGRINRVKFVPERVFNTFQLMDKDG